MLIFRQDFRSCHCESLDDQLRAIYSAALGMGVARGYYGAAYPAGECVDVLCPAGCTARRASRGEKGGPCRKWPGFSRKNNLLTFLDASYFLFVRLGLFFFLQSRRRFCARCASANSCRFQWAVINNINHEPLFMATTTTAATQDYFVRLFRTLKFKERNLGLMDSSGFRECSGNEASSHQNIAMPQFLRFFLQNRRHR